MSPLVSVKILSAFCLSLKKAANRRGSDAMDLPLDYSRRYWKRKAIPQLQGVIKAHKANNVRMFFLQQATRDAIDRQTAESIHNMSPSMDVTVVLTIIGKEIGPWSKPDKSKPDKDAVVVKAHGRVHFQSVGSATIFLEQHRPEYDWYSAAVSNGAEERRYGPLYFVAESSGGPREFNPQTSPEPHGSAKKFRRVLAALRLFK